MNKKQQDAGTAPEVPVDKLSITEKSSDPGAAPAWRHLIGKALWLLLYPLCLGTVSWMRTRPETVESFFSEGLYPLLSSAVGAVFSVFPFSFAEMLVYAIITALLTFAAVCIVRAVQRRLPLRRLLSWLLTIFIIGGAGFNAFYWMWGFNYFRVPLRTRLGIRTVEKSPELLAGLCFQLAEAANELRAGLPEDADGVFTYEGGKTEALGLVPAAYTRLGQVMPVFSRAVYRPKPVLASELLSYAGISGIYIPFTEEANVNVDDPALLVGSSGAHETAHFLGVASEDEANFVAYLACISSESASLQYSGLMLALVHAGNALSRVSPDAYTELWDRYSAAVVRDFDQYNTYLKAHQGETADQVQKMNDNYLKANGQSAGVASYGQMVDLLLDFYVQLSSQ